MKTNKFKYTVWCYPNEDSTALSPETKTVNCVTLAEARLVAARFYRAVIQCSGQIEYRKGLEVFNNGN